MVNYSKPKSSRGFDRVLDNIRSLSGSKILKKLTILIDYTFKTGVLFDPMNLSKADPLFIGTVSPQFDFIPATSPALCVHENTGRNIVQVCFIIFITTQVPYSLTARFPVHKQHNQCLGEK